MRGTCHIGACSGISDSHHFVRPCGPSKRVRCLSQGTWSDRKPHAKKTPFTHWCEWCLNQRLPILPGRLHPSTFGVCGLNCCVRHGNRWTPAAITTEFVEGVPSQLPRKVSKLPIGFTFRTHPVTGCIQLTPKLRSGISDSLAFARRLRLLQKRLPA